MPFLIALLGVLGAAAFWWYRMKAMNDAAREVADVVGRVQGNIRRKKLRKQAALSPLTAIDDPVVAAATLITALAAEHGPILPKRETVIREVISQIADNQKYQQPQKDNIHLYQHKESDIGAQGVFRCRLWHSHSKKRKRHYHQGCGKDHHSLTRPTLGFFQLEA